jgi:hypothetical protein
MGSRGRRARQAHAVGSGRRAAGPSRVRGRTCGVGAAAITAAALIAALLAACGSVHGPARGGRPAGSGAATATRANGTAPETGSRAEALTLARRLLARLVPPQGARRDHGRSLPRLLRQPAQTMGGTPDLVDIHEVFSLRQSMPAAYRLMRERVPAGMELNGYGQAGDRGLITVDDVTYAPRSLPRGIYAAELVTSVIAVRRGGSLMRADAQVIWYPPRTTAEHLDPADFDAVKVSMTRLTSSGHQVTRMITDRSPGAIARLARLLDGLSAAPVRVFSCPLIRDTYRVTFVASRRGSPDVVVLAFGCLTDDVTVGGKAQPPLWDSGKLAGAVRRLLAQRAS